MNKSLFVVAALLTVSSLAHASDRCSSAQLIKKIQEQCGNGVRLGEGKIGYYQGEVSDTYIVPVISRNESKNMSVKMTDGGSQCTEILLEVEGQCPN